MRILLCRAVILSCHSSKLSFSSSHLSISIWGLLQKPLRSFKDHAISVFGDVRDDFSGQQLQYILDLLVKLVFGSLEAILINYRFLTYQVREYSLPAFPGSVKTTNIKSMKICFSQTYQLTLVIRFTSSWKSPKSTCVLASLDLRALAVLANSKQCSFMDASFFTSSTTVFCACCVQASLRTLSPLSQFQWTSSMIQSFHLKNLSNYSFV